MSSLLSTLFLSTLLIPSISYSEKKPKPELFNVGSVATVEQIAGWDIDVRPDGHGLPDGGGTPADGEDMYDEKCSSCHGTFGEGEGAWPKLIGEVSSIRTGINPEKTVGTFWASPSTLIDYIHRAMPFTAPQSLSWDETWAISAYILYLNDIIEDEDFEFNRASFFSIKMPNAGHFIADQRPDVQAIRCMKNCKDPNNIKIKTALLGYASGAEDADQIEAAQQAGTDEKTPQAKAIPHRGKAVYQQACGLCHEQGIAGAPKISDKEDWQQRLNKGEKTLIDHAINGFQGSTGIMPPKGGQMHLSDEEVRMSVLYLLNVNGLSEKK